jgi:uncharacterized protein YneF (UPF0154 family)
MILGATLSTGAIVGIVFGVIGGIVLGVILGVYFAYKHFKKQMRENPPITEDQIRAMYTQMGRKPSEQQVKSIMSMFKRQGENK